MIRHLFLLVLTQGGGGGGGGGGGRGGKGKKGGGRKGRTLFGPSKKHAKKEAIKVPSTRQCLAKKARKVRTEMQEGVIWEGRGTC